MFLWEVRDKLCGYCDEWLFLSRSVCFFKIDKNSARQIALITLVLIYRLNRTHTPYYAQNSWRGTALCRQILKIHSALLDLRYGKRQSWL